MSVDFEPAMVRTSSYLDGMDASPFMLDGSTMDYLQYDQAPGSPAFGAGVNLSSSPHIDYNIQLPGAMGVMEPFGYTFGARSYSPGADSASISPPTLSYHLSAGETSDDSSRRSRGENPTPPPVPYAATVPRSHRFNPIQVPATRASTRAAASRRRGSRSSMSNGDLDSDAEEEEDYQPSTTGGPDLRREAVRRQRIESEQRRRDELREGYARLKAVLPPSSAKSSKVNLLDRAAIHVKSLEKMKQQADAKLKSAEAELVRVRSLNEVLSLRAVQQREAMSGSMAPY